MGHSMKILGICSAASRSAGAKTAALRIVPWIVGVAAVLLASGASAQTGPVGPQGSAGPVSVIGTMGAMNYNGTGSMSGTDITAVPPTTTQSQSLNHTTAAGGAAIDVDVNQLLADFPDIANCLQLPGQGGLSGCENLARNGLINPIIELYVEAGLTDPGQASASFSGLSAIPMGTGTSTLKETWSIPLQLGLRVPARYLGINSPALEFLVHGGVDFDRWKAGFNLTEAGAPGGPGTSASKTWWSADPAVGVGARYHLSRNWFVGVDSTWAFAHSQSISAPSANFAPLQSYTLATGSHTMTTVLFELGYTFGGPSASSAPMVAKAR